ncbi:MAG: DeoR/GlpR transcriptional regulator, partial [Oscillospiraceae bacterium]|nr:DeoR/GlpR transcriptional regulator [Oscillospiraceae bacterium]
MPKNFYAAVDMRRQEILRYLANHQNCALGEIAEEFKTSEMTVRRDLHALSAESLITQNSKGLYSLNCDPSFDPRYFLRYSAHHLWKAAIARAAVSLISPGDFIFMDSGTTVLELSKHLEGIEPLSVATNNLYIPMYLSQRPSRIQVEFLGGDVHLPSMSTYGLHACRKIESYNADLLFFSADGLDFEAGVSTDEYRLIDVKTSMLHSARTSVLLIDSSKLNRRAVQRVAALSELDVVVTDSHASDADLARL